MYTERRRTSSMEEAHNSHHPPSGRLSHTYAHDGRQRSASYTSMPPSPHYQHQRSLPPSPTATRAPPPPSPISRERPTSSYYDPTSEARANHGENLVNGGSFHARSPIHVGPCSLHSRPRQSQAKLIIPIAAKPKFRASRAACHTSCTTTTSSSSLLQWPCA